MPYTGKDLIAWGHKPGPLFADAIALANSSQDANESDVRESVQRFIEANTPKRIDLRPAGVLDYSLNIEAESEFDARNIEVVKRHMDELMRVPVIKAGAVMPDACPSGTEPGTIPVGGVIAAEALMPGAHSADICCSMAYTSFGQMDPKRVLDAGIARTNFGPFSRPEEDRFILPEWLEERFRSNPFLKGMLSYAKAFLGTQGDGNHFFYVGMRESTGETVLMTHHGSRKPGALLYKQGTKVAEAHTKQVSPEVGQHNSWIDPESQEHKDYWDALQIIRLWTRENHFQIHDAVLNALDLPVPDYGVDRFWNEHNFVFERDGLYYHAKGATPAYSGFSEDDTGLTLIPLNMAEPVLITRGLDNPSGLGFAPHGAGRNMGRKAYVRNVIGDQDRGEVFARETAGIDARFLGEPDLSELPGAYKNADQVRAQIDRFGLAEVTDLIQPYGSIMAGEMEMPWQRKRREKMKENPQ